MKLWIPSRDNVPGTNIFIEILTKDNNEPGFNGRKVMILVSGGPGGNHTVYNAIKKDLLEFVDLVLFDPRGCGYSDVSPVETSRERCEKKWLIDKNNETPNPLTHRC